MNHPSSTDRTSRTLTTRLADPNPTPNPTPTPTPNPNPSPYPYLTPNPNPNPNPDSNSNPNLDPNPNPNPNPNQAPLIWAMRQMRQVMRTPPLARYVREELVPGSAVRSEVQLDDAVRCGPRQFRGQELGGCDKTELPVNHLAGTSRLASSIGEGVVDLRLRVHGVSGLRIADASVMPFPPSGNTHATCMMIGERAAAFMLEEFSRQDKARAQVPT